MAMENKIHLMPKIRYKIRHDNYICICIIITNGNVTAMVYICSESTVAGKTSDDL